MQLSEWIDEWLERRRMDVAQSTHEKNRYHCQHIEDELGAMKLDELHFEDVESFYSRLELAPNTIRSIHGTLSKCLSDAVRARQPDIEHNPCAEANPPDEETQNFEVLSEPEAKQLQRNLYMKHPYDVMIYTALRTGMRKSELSGLTWKHLDLDRGVIEVRQTLTQCPDGDLVLGEPKSKSSYRAISLSEETTKKLKFYKKVQLQRRLKSTDWPREEFVFTSEVGTPIYARSLKRRFDKHLDECDLPQIRFHDLRHTHATILLKHDINPKKVKERLGHGSVEVTLDRYSHVTPTMQEELAETFDQAIS